MVKKTFRSLRASHCSELYHQNYSGMDCKILRQYFLIIDPSIVTKQKKIDFLKVLDKETPLTTEVIKSLKFGDILFSFLIWNSLRTKIVSYHIQVCR